MTGLPRLRRYASFGAAAVLALALTACAQEYPNTTFQPNSEYGRAIDFLWDRLLFFGTIVFVFVEGALLYIVFRYRRRDESTIPPQTHGNTALEITWTLIPAVILVFIAVPTVKTIFETQAKASPDALTIEVYGRQWWWEFHYPEQKFSTANEIYIPKGKTVNFVLRTKDVIHSFWVPQLAGKRDLIANRTNYMWFTPDSAAPTTVWNGFCTEYCGASHANMKFRVVTVEPEEFESWVRHQQAPAFFNTKAAPTIADGAISTDTLVQDSVQLAMATPAAPAPVEGYIIPPEKIPAYAIPNTPVPSKIKFDDSLVGDPARGEELFMGAGTCMACHTIQGTNARSIVGPDLTHVGSRISIGGGLYKNDAYHLARWIKNARVMKPGNLMTTLGKGEYDPILKMTTPAGLTDQQIADLVAYLQALR